MRIPDGYLGPSTDTAACAAVLFGIQPLLHTAPDGRALYAPYPLSVAVPAMMIPHLTLFGLAEGVITGLVVRYLVRSRPAWIVAPAPEDIPR
ncbi:MAG: energy-coupling factor ABC transporter permease [Deltaproteobacteria bacterium]|nr:energy-coupling factor ABC transporter permease [Deltaproteobacteria bacterium]